MNSFDHPRSELEDLPGGKDFLHHEHADHGIADLQRLGSLLHGDPMPGSPWCDERVAQYDKVFRTVRRELREAGFPK